MISLQYKLATAVEGDQIMRRVEVRLAIELSERDESSGWASFLETSKRLLGYHFFLPVGVRENSCSIFLLLSRLPSVVDDSQLQ